jgi:hypothetical protein
MVIDAELDSKDHSLISCNSIERELGSFDARTPELD